MASIDHSLFLTRKFLLFKHIGSSSEGAGQLLSSSGSCLKDYRPNPFIECNGRGTCHFYAKAYTYWMTTVESKTQFKAPQTEILEGNKLRNRISKCTVCMKSTPIFARETRKDTFGHSNSLCRCQQ